MTSIAVVVGTFGDDQWIDLARTRAIPSARAQTHPAVSIHHVHADTLARARNLGIERAEGAEWIVCLDADDELDPGYLAAIAAVAGEGDALIQPQTAGVHPDGRVEPPVFIAPAASLLDRNHMVIGTAARREQLLRVGGFGEEPYAEDWCLWLRCWIDGAELLRAPGAIYRVHVNASGRNQPDPKVQLRVYHDIRLRMQRLAAERQVALR